MVKRGRGNTVSKEKVEDEIVKLGPKAIAGVAGHYAAHHLLGPQYGPYGALAGFQAAEPVAQWLVDRTRQVDHEHKNKEARRLIEQAQRKEKDRNAYERWVVSKYGDRSGSGLLGPSHPAMNPRDTRYPRTS